MRRAARVGIVMGSDSDWPVMKEAATALGEFGVAHEADVVSAHRMPDAMLAYGREAAERGLQVIIAGAGGAAHLPGMLASVTPLPVIGVPVALKYLDGMDSLLSIVQMPAGVPVATVAVGNARNAGLLAVRILAAVRPRAAAEDGRLPGGAEEVGRGEGQDGPRRGLRRAQGRFLSRELAPDRLVGLDVARCLALLGMVTTHVIAPRDADGTLSFGQALAGGRSAALFAVLAGVSLALMTGRREPVHGRERAARSLGIVVRALLIAGLGLFLGGLGSGLAIILTYYGLLFLLGLPFAGLRAPALLTLGLAWAVVGPVVSQVVRPHLPDRGFASPYFDQLDQPGQLLSELLFTGYYPVVPWLAYLLVGMAVGRMDLSRRRVQAWLAGGGAALAVAATLVSNALTSRPSVIEPLLTTNDAWPAATGPELLNQISGGMYGNTPTGGAWEWLLVVAPHSTTPFDLAQTIGSALAVIGLCLLVVGALDTSGVRTMAIVFGAGTMTLSLYTLHVVMRTEYVLPEETPSSYPFHLIALLGIGALYVYGGRRGPLEWLVAALSGRAAAKVRLPPSSRDSPRRMCRLRASSTTHSSWTIPSGSVADHAAAEGLGLTALLLGVEAALLGAAARLGRPPLRGRWGEGGAQQVGEAFAGGHPVAVLRAVLGGVDHDPAVGQPRAEVAHGPGPLRLGERRRRGDVVLQLDPAVGGVDRLTAGSGRPGEPLDQLGRRDHQPVRQAGSGRDPEVAAGCVHPRPRDHSIAGQASITIGTPAARVRSNASRSRTPSWNHTPPAPIATAWSANSPAASERRKTSTTSTGNGTSARVG